MYGFARIEASVHSRNLIDMDTPFITRSLIETDRAIHDIQRGLPVLLTGADALLIASAEMAREETLVFMTELAGKSPTLLIAAERARKLGFSSASALVLSLPEHGALEAIHDIINPLHAAVDLSSTAFLKPTTAPVAAETGLALIKLASLLPAALIVDVQLPAAVSANHWSMEHGLLTVEAAHVQRYKQDTADALVPVSRARVPLADAHATEVMLFRPPHGGIEHLAVIVGNPAETPLVRLHSSCVTGDILGSLRCDCGAQLHASLRAMAQSGGVLLYLNQEGRGIGIANKLRAYAMQDQGLDTIDANEIMGFAADERDFAAAAQMLKSLGFTRIRLMTNNPRKIQALEAHGIAIAERVPLNVVPNPHNAQYLNTKATRAGHALDGF